MGMWMCFRHQASDDTIAWYENEGGADPVFTERIITTAADGASSVYAADMDGDGDLDVLSASIIDDTIAWYENDGGADPVFTEHLITINANAARSVYAADMDGDGDLDVLTASEADDTIAWYENDGGVDPVFTERIITTAAIGAQSVYAADMDGDGDLDVLSASLNDDTIAWYENDGGADPVFTERVITTAADFARSVYTADVDGDGDVDVLSASERDDTIAWYENDGGADPVFTKRVISTAADGAFAVFASDLDGDGDLDVLSASSNNDTIAWYRTAQRPLFAAMGTTFTHTELAMDVDGNTLTYSLTGGADELLFSIDDITGELRFENVPPVDAPTDSNGDNVYRVNIGVSDGFSTIYRLLAIRAFIDDDDDDNDGVPDVMDAFPLDPSEQVDTDGDGIGNNADTDDDGDGTLDSNDNAPLDASSTTAPEWTLAAELPNTQVISATANGASSVFSIDLDNDGDLDVLSASRNDNTIAWYENDGGDEPVFTERVITAAADAAQSVYAADMDGDGDLDVLSASVSDDTIAWYENDGGAEPVFTERVITTAADGAQSVYAADVDGDGDLDVLSASVNDDTIAWYENDGGADPVFTERIITTAADGAQSVYAADVDGDGDVDVLSASSNNDTIAWYENDGGVDPVFNQRVITITADNAQSVYAADVDGDGDLDVLSASRNDDTIAWYENDGGADPVFTERVITTAANGANSVYAADVDGDGDLDVLSASEFDDTTAWYENDGGTDPVFTKRVITTAADGAQSVYAADVDGDGDLDVLSASVNDDTIAWYRTAQRQLFAAMGTTFTHTELAMDVDGNTLTYSLTGGADELLFSIDDITGELRFENVPPVDAPTDSNGDNVYRVNIGVSDGFSTIYRLLAIRAFIDDDDDDNDGVPDVMDAFPFDPTRS